MPKLINDIRIQGIDKLIQLIQDIRPKQPVFVGRRYWIISDRYLYKLLSLKFESGQGRVFILNLDFDRAHGSVEPLFEGMCRMYSCGIDVSRIVTYDETARQHFFVNAIHSMLSAIAIKEGLDRSKIDSVRDDMIEFGDKLEIEAASKSSVKFDVEATFTVEEHPQLFLRVNDKRSAKTFCVCLVELEEPVDGRRVATRIGIKARSVVIHPRNTELGRATLRRYWERLDTAGYHSGSSNFIEIPFSSITVES